MTIDAPNVDGNCTMALLVMIFNKLIVPLAKHKTMGPLKVIEYLGIILDFGKMEARLPEEKVNRISKLLDTCMVKKSCTKRELLQLLGHLNFVTRVIVPGRTFVSYLLTIATSAKELEHWVHFNSDCMEDLRMWKMFLDQWNCVSLFHETTITVASDMELYTYASSKKGFVVVSFEGVGSVIDGPQIYLTRVRKTIPNRYCSYSLGEILVYKTHQVLL